MSVEFQAFDLFQIERKIIHAMGTIVGRDAAADNSGGLVGFPTAVPISQGGRVVKLVDGLVSSRAGSAQWLSLLNGSFSRI